MQSPSNVTRRRFVSRIASTCAAVCVSGTTRAQVRKGGQQPRRRACERLSTWRTSLKDGRTKRRHDTLYFASYLRHAYTQVAPWWRARLRVCELAAGAMCGSRLAERERREECRHAGARFVKL